MPELKTASVIGDPIRHSRSPLIHNHWLQRYGIEGAYTAVHVKSEELIAFLESIRSGERVGANVTMPHKVSVATHCDILSDAAQSIGAVNTLSLQNGQLFGDNTDAYGFARNLDDQIPGWENAENALVLGAGGAARAILHALTARGINNIVLLNRTLKNAEALAVQFQNIGETGTLDNLPHHFARSDLIINTTSIGIGDSQMKGDFWDFSMVKPGTMAADIVYVPLITPFLNAAQNAGCAISDGLGMLLHQAAPGFERWFGLAPEVDGVLRQKILDDL